MSLPLRDPDRHTYGECCGWPEDQRYELIDDAAYAMAPAPTRQHQRLTFELAREIADALDGSGCEVNVAPFDVRLPEGNEADADIITVVPFSTRRARSGHSAAHTADRRFRTTSRKKTA